MGCVKSEVFASVPAGHFPASDPLATLLGRWLGAEHCRNSGGLSQGGPGVLSKHPIEENHERMN